MIGLMRVWLVAAIAVGCGASPGYAQTIGRWSSGFGQGIVEAAVRNGDGSVLRLSCPSGNDRVRPDLTLTVRARASSVGETRPVVFVVDGRDLPWAMDRAAAQPGFSEYRFEASDAEGEESLGRLVEALRRGRTLTVLTPDDRRRHSFSLRGSGRELAGCPRE